VRRSKRHARNPEYLDLLTKTERWCPYCGEEFKPGDIVELHHAKGADWAISCKKHEKIHIDYRALRLHGPATDPQSCHTQVFVNKELQTKLVIEQLLSVFGDCELSEKLELAGYRG
jgi:uncharacterized Zn-finger protein